MSAKTDRFLRHVAAATGYPVKAYKLAWKRMSHRQRRMFRFKWIAKLGYKP